MPHPLFLFPLLAVILSIPLQTYSQDDDNNNTPFVTDCQGETTNFSTPFTSNLRLLLDNLISSTPKSPSLFSLLNFTSPQIFGLAQCLPNLTASACAACLYVSSLYFPLNPFCGLTTSLANRARNCLVRYSYKEFYSLLEQRIIVYENNLQNASAAFSQRASALVKSVIASAAAAASRFAVGATNGSVADVSDIYGMGWCSMDLSSSNCAQCLDTIWETRLAGKIRGEAAFVSCVLRFETFQFYSIPVIAPAAAPSPLSHIKNSSAAIAPIETGGEWLIYLRMALVMIT